MNVHDQVKEEHRQRLKRRLHVALQLAQRRVRRDDRGIIGRRHGLGNFQPEEMILENSGSYSAISDVLERIRKRALRKTFHRRKTFR